MRTTVIRHEIVVGWFIVAALLLAAVGLVMKTRTKGLIDSVELAFIVPHGKGLRSGAPVELKGIEVGHVGGIQLTKDDRVHVTLWLSKTYAEHVHTDAVATIVAPPLLGTSKVEIDPGQVAAVAPSGHILQGRLEGGLIDNLQVKVDDLIAKVDTLTGTATSALDESRALLAKIESGDGLAAKIVGDPDLAKDMRETIANLKNTTERFDQEGMKKALEVIEEARGLVIELRSEQGDLRTLLRDADDAVITVRDAVQKADLERTVASLRETADALGKTAANMDVSEETRDALAALQEASQAFRRLSDELARQPNTVIFGRELPPSPGTRR